MRSRVVIDQQVLATSCVHWKHTVRYSNYVKRTAQTICTGYKENTVFESGYFSDYLCHWNGFLLSLVIFNLFLYLFLIRGGGRHWQGTASGPESHIGRSKKWHWQGRKVTLAGPKSHTRAKMSHWSVIIHYMVPLWCVVLHCLACIVLHCIGSYCMSLRIIALSYDMLHIANIHSRYCVVCM